MVNVTRAVSEPRHKRLGRLVSSQGTQAPKTGKKKNRQHARSLPAGNVGLHGWSRKRPRQLPGATEDKRPVCTRTGHGQRGPRRRGGGEEGSRTYIPKHGCMRERFIMAPTSALFLQPRKMTQATSRGEMQTSCGAQHHAAPR